MEREAKAIAKNPHVTAKLFSLGNGSNHVNIEINAKPPASNARGKTQLFQIHEALERAGIPHLHLGPEEIDEAKSRCSIGLPIGSLEDGALSSSIPVASLAASF